MIEFLKEFWEFLRERKKYWLLPIIIVLALFGKLPGLCPPEMLIIAWCGFRRSYEHIGTSSPGIKSQGLV